MYKLSLNPNPNPELLHVRLRSAELGGEGGGGGRFCRVHAAIGYVLAPQGSRGTGTPVPHVYSL